MNDLAQIDLLNFSKTKLNQIVWTFDTCQSTNQIESIFILTNQNGRNFNRPIESRKTYGPIKFHFSVLVIVLRVRRLLVLLPAVRKFKIVWGRREGGIRPRHFGHHARSIDRHIPRVAVGCCSPFWGDTSWWHVSVSCNTDRVRSWWQLRWDTAGCSIVGCVDVKRRK